MRLRGEGRHTWAKTSDFVSVGRSSKVLGAGGGTSAVPCDSAEAIAKVDDGVV